MKTRVNFYKKNIEKINFYLPLFEEQLQNRKIPLEIKYLPIIESRLDPSAVSKVGATDIKRGDEVKFVDFINDVKSIINHFRSTKRFERVVVIGHSEGALIGMIASRSIAQGLSLLLEQV